MKHIFVIESSQLFQKIYLINYSHHFMDKVPYINAYKLSGFGLHLLVFPFVDTL